MNYNDFLLIGERLTREPKYIASRKVVIQVDRLY